MPARFNAFPPDRAALVRLIDDDTPYRIGRAKECELCIEHASVSRFHAELQGSGSEWNLHDTGSKNGLRVDGHLVLKSTLQKTTWFAIGDVYCSLEPLPADAAALLLEHQATRRSNSKWLSQRLSPSLGIGTLIPQTLDVVLELSGLDRGFVLYAPPGEPLRVRASRGLVTQDFAQPDFAGSAAAVDQALASQQSVVCCDTADSPWLGSRPSVRLGGIRAIVCVPLRVSDTALGALYVDSRRPGPPVTELDLELIESVAEHAAAAIAARSLHGEVNELLKIAAEAGLQTQRWDELRERRGGG